MNKSNGFSVQPSSIGSIITAAKITNAMAGIKKSSGSNVVIRALVPPGAGVSHA